MNRPFRTVGILAFSLIAVFALWAAWMRSGRPSSQAALSDTIHSAITQPAEFAKSHFTGGVGAVLQMDQATGMPLIRQITIGSPAEKAGLQAGDLIIKIDGVTTSGRSLAQNVESIRGFVTGSVTLTIRREGSTNLECVIHRSSWQSLGISNNPPNTVTPLP